MDKQDKNVISEIKTFADELLDKYHPGDGWSFVPLQTDVDAASFREGLKAGPCSELLLPDNSSLSAQTAEWYREHDGDAYAEHQPDLDMYLNTPPTRVIGGVALRVWGKGWDFKKTGNWQREIDIQFVHENEENGNSATETLKVVAFKLSKPSLLRSISSPSYADQGYEGHNWYSGDSSNSKIEYFLKTVRSLEKYTTSD